MESEMERPTERDEGRKREGKHIPLYLGFSG